MESVNRTGQYLGDPGFLIDGIRHITPRDFQGLQAGKAVLLDVRPEYERTRLFGTGSVIRCPYRDVILKKDDLPRDVLIVVADATGLRSRHVVRLLMQEGFGNVCNLAGGIVDWERQGLPVELNRTTLFTGPCMCQLKNRNKNHKIENHGKEK